MKYILKVEMSHLDDIKKITIMSYFELNNHHTNLT